MRLPRRHIVPFLIGACLIAGIAVLAHVQTLSVTLKQDAAARTARDMQAQFDTLARQLDGDLAVFDLALKEAGAAHGNARIAPINHKLVTQYMSFIDVLDAAGQVAASTRAVWQRSENWSSRDYFREQLRGNTGRLAIGRRFNTENYQNGAFPISRRLETPDGQFAGVVVIGVRAAWLHDLLVRMPPLTHAAAAIRFEDGKILARAPFDSDDISRADAEPGWRAWREGGAVPATGGEGGHRLLRQLETAPLVLDLTLGRAAAETMEGAWFSWLVLPPLVPFLASLILAGLALRLRAGEARIMARAQATNAHHTRQLATMNHELRTPLTAILGQADLLQDEGGLTGHQRDRVTRMLDAGAAMRAVIERVTDATRPEAVSVVPRPVCRDLDLLVKSCRDMVEERARKRGLTLSLQIDPAAPRYARLHPDLVEQVLNNLLSNAVKYTAAGEVTLRLRQDPEFSVSGQAGISGPSQAWLVFEVADTGPGIPRGLRHRLFREYDRLGASAARAEGSGLGLAISAEKTRAMGGQIGYRDNPGGGSIFWLSLPFAAASPDEMERETSVGPLPVEAARPVRILLADDIDATRAVTADILRGAGHTVVEVTDGEAAIHAAGQQDFDLIVTDMRMPKCDGIEAARRIRTLPGPRGRIPIVLLTADVSAWRSAASLRAEIDFHVTKPFKPHELLRPVEAASRLGAAAGDPDEPVLDRAILDQLLASMGPDAIDGHLDTAARRIEALLACLAVSPGGVDTRDAVHDLVGVAGLLGLSALSAAARRFDQDQDPVSNAVALSAAASEALVTLRHRGKMAASM